MKKWSARNDDAKWKNELECQKMLYVSIPKAFFRVYFIFWASHAISFFSFLHSSLTGPTTPKMKRMKWKYTKNASFLFFWFFRLVRTRWKKGIKIKLPKKWKNELAKTWKNEINEKNEITQKNEIKWKNEKKWKNEIKWKNDILKKML